MIDIQILEVPRAELENPNSALMRDLNAWGAAYYADVEEYCLEGATDSVRFLVSEWLAGKPVSTNDGPFPSPEYDTYTDAEKQDAHNRIHQIIGWGCG